MNRAARADAADALCRDAYDVAGAPTSGCALVAVGGYGRRELAPYSDLDVVLVHEDRVDLGDAGEKVWYPIWDSGARLDHAVRSLPGMLEQADNDPRVALGLLDVRHLAGDMDLAVRLRSEVLAQWRRTARDRLPDLRALVRKRHEVVGELAHLSVPDLKEAEGGLRDATVLMGLVATWLVDVPHVDLERSRRSLLDVRDALHEVAGRATDRVGPDLWDDLADRLELADGVAAQRDLRELGRRIAHLSRLTWRRVDGVLARPASRTGVRRPVLTAVEPGIALSGCEVVLTRDASPRGDPTLLLRAAAVAAEREAELAPATAARLGREGAAPAEPWPPAARQALVRMLAGPGLLPVWETLEETGSLESFLPEWGLIHLLPHASEIHRYTVDRHAVETCIEASALIRNVARPDVLLVAALLHDIGKGGPTDHSVAGEPIARSVATRMGYDERSVDLVARLVRHHLLLARTATTRDPDDPDTAQALAGALVDAETLDLLLALTEADARATSSQAWTSWRAGLVRTVAARTAAVLEDVPLVSPDPEEMAIPADVRRGGTAAFSVAAGESGVRVTVLAPDRVGLLADVAAVFALQRASVRSARAWSQEDIGVSVWEVAEDHLDERVLTQRFEAIEAGRLDPSARWRAGPGRMAPTVAVRPEASARATVLEVRTDDRPGVVHRVCAALAALDLAVRSAHVDTLGPQAVDVFYVQEPAAGALTDTRAAAAAHAVRAALSG